MAASGRGGEDGAVAPSSAAPGKPRGGREPGYDRAVPRPALDEPPAGGALAAGRESRLLVVVNPAASTVSASRRERALGVLGAGAEVTAVATEAPGHAAEICADARGQGYDAVCVLGGDGTVNEAANGLAGSDTPLACLPGGCTNVFCRTLGVPDDLIAAGHHLLARLEASRPRRVDTATMNGRHFLFASGIGVTAVLMEHADRHPRLKARLGQHYFAYAGLSTFGLRRGPRLPRVCVTADGRSVEAVTVMVQHSDPLTWIAGRPVRVCEGEGLETGTISLALSRGARARELPGTFRSLLSGDPATVLARPGVEGVAAVPGARVESADGRPFAVEVDGSFAGRFDAVDYGVAPGSLSVLA